MCFRHEFLEKEHLQQSETTFLFFEKKIHFATGYIQWFLNIGRIYPVKNSIFLYFIKTRCFCEKTTENAKILF